MCGIVGALLSNVHNRESLDRVNFLMSHIMKMSTARGRDGYGYRTVIDEKIKTVKFIERNGFKNVTVFFPIEFTYATLIGNFRAEPTTEFVRQKVNTDQQPYSVGDWSIVHNGTIANDKELRTNEYPTSIDSAAIVEAIDSYERHTIYTTIKKLKGSFAILAQHSLTPYQLIVTCNYKPIWYVRIPEGYFFASSEEFFPKNFNPIMVKPYSYNTFSSGSSIISFSLLPHRNKRAVIVCSGGLDSVVAATKMMHDGYEIELLHFQYGSRAEGPEEKAIQAIANELGCLLTILPMHIYRPGDSPLLQMNIDIAGGEAGAEFAHEWVPARNLVMLSLTIAYAEANSIETIALGNNLEEAGAYPDNEPEFINRLNTVLPFAVNNGHQVHIVMPVGNMMKHEIVKLGLELNAPLNLTWSCYRHGEKHCGTCGPCYMRRTAFQINEIEEVIEYEK